MAERLTECEQLLSSEECWQIIKNELNPKDVNYLKLNSFKLVKCSPDLVGFMGDYYKLEIVIEEKNSNQTMALHYFVKTLPLDNKIYREELEHKRVIEKESAIYAKILPNVQRYCESDLFPKSFLNRPDVMVLEDYNNPAKNLRQIKENESYTVRHHEIFMQHLAKLHAAGIAWSIKESVDVVEKFEDFLFELELTKANVWYTTGVKGILHLAQIHPKFKYAKAQDFINQKLANILLNMEDYTKPSKIQRNVLCHRDSWDRNIFWEYCALTNEPISCRIVDFQLMRYSPPAIDVLYYLCNFNLDSLKIEKFLQFYYDSLKLQLKLLNLPENLITEKEFQADCKRALLPVLTNRAVCEPFMKMPKGWSQAMRAADPEKYDYFMHCDRTEMFGRIAEVDSTFMDTIMQPIQDLMKYFGFESKLL